MPQLYTLEEAKRVLATDLCASDGHDYEVQERREAHEPRSVICNRCGSRWMVDNPLTRNGR